jgi:hypothetical protein
MIDGITFPGASGSALLVTLIALSLFSLLGLFVSLTATTGVQISDNYEGQMQATYAALAGINHTRALIRGLSLDDLFRGPDGAWDSSAQYTALAKGYGFRNPVPVSLAQRLDIVDPASDVSAISDDGIFSTGFIEGSPGTVLIPQAGIAQESPNPYGQGSIVLSRYFVKVTDNNKEATEIAGDPSDSPFIDGDGVVIVRSLGIARTLTDSLGSVVRRNSVAVFEARLKRLHTWDLPGALVVLGPDCEASFSGVYEISGGALPGIGTIDTDSFDAISPDRTIRNAAGTDGYVTGGNEAIPSVKDITAGVLADPDQRRLLIPESLSEFVQVKAPAFADSCYYGNQSWSGGSAPDLGVFNPAKPWNAPGQNPKVTVVRGDLEISGSVSGGGLLIVTGSLSYSGPFVFSGIVLVIGTGTLMATGPGSVIEGGVIISKLSNDSGSEAFGKPSVTIGEGSRIVSNRANIRMALGLIPAVQIGFREIAGSDP